MAGTSWTGRVGLLLALLALGAAASASLFLCPLSLGGSGPAPGQKGMEGALPLPAPGGRSASARWRELLGGLRPRLGPGLILELAVLALVVAWFFLFRPQFLGGPAGYVIVTGHSMVPTLHDGDLAIVRRQDAYAPGDIVAYRIPKGEPGEGHIIIHRVVGGSAEEGYVTQGDNRTTPDTWRPTAADVVGKLWLRVPAVGETLGLLRSPLLMATVAAALTAALVLTAPADRRPEEEEE
jgi:signal peptidase I